MKKIKIFEHGSAMVLEEYVNRFTAEHPISVTDIQFRVIPCANNTKYSVMIVYDTTMDKVDNQACKLYLLKTA